MCCKLIVSVAHTTKKSSVAHIYNIGSSHSSSNKVRRFCDTAFAVDDIFCYFVEIHSLTYFQKFTHKKLILVLNLFYHKMGNFSIKYTHKLLIIVREIKKPLATRFTGVGNFL